MGSCYEPSQVQGASLRFAGHVMGIMLLHVSPIRLYQYWTCSCKEHPRTLHRRKSPGFSYWTDGSHFRHWNSCVSLLVFARTVLLLTDAVGDTTPTCSCQQ